MAASTEQAQMLPPPGTTCGRVCRWRGSREGEQVQQVARPRLSGRMRGNIGGVFFFCQRCTAGSQCANPNRKSTQSPPSLPPTGRARGGSRGATLDGLSFFFLLFSFFSQLARLYRFEVRVLQYSLQSTETELLLGCLKTAADSTVLD